MKGPWSLPSPCSILVILRWSSSRYLHLCQCFAPSVSLPTHPLVTKTFWSRSSKMQVSLRLLQLSHGCDPEHLIFCLRHRAQLVLCQTHQQRLSYSYIRCTHAFEDFLTTRFLFPAIILVANTTRGARMRSQSRECGGSPRWRWGWRPQATRARLCLFGFISSHHHGSTLPSR